MHIRHTTAPLPEPAHLRQSSTTLPVSPHVRHGCATGGRYCPVPSHRPHGASSRLPAPLHEIHIIAGRVNTPVPLHLLQRTGALPAPWHLLHVNGRWPLPLQRGQGPCN